MFFSKGQLDSWPFSLYTYHLVFMLFSSSNREKNKLLFSFLKSEGSSLTDYQKEFYAKLIEEELKDFYFKASPVIISANSFAKELGVSHYKVKRWIELGSLPAKKLNTNRYLINLQEAEIFLKQEGFFNHFQYIKKSFLF